MICSICYKKVIEVQRRINSLFKISHRHICNSCLNKANVKSNYQVLPINGFLLYHFWLIETKKVEVTAFMSFFESYYVFALKKNILILIYDALTNDLFQLLEQLDFGDILLLTVFQGNVFD